MTAKPIGIFDSGLGGLSVWRAIRHFLPHESLLYMGDGLNCPYGDRDEAEVAQLTFNSVQLLLAEGCKLVVIACNTATIAAIAQLRSAYPDVPFVGLEPAIKPACLSTKSGVVGVLATQRSLEGEKYRASLAKYSNSVTVLNTPGAGFVELVEDGLENTPQAMDIVRPVIESLLASSVDQIVLGCTHYPFLQPLMEQIVGDRGVTIIDPAPSVARQVARLLVKHSLQAPSTNHPYYEYITLAGDDYAERIRLRAESLARG